METWLIILLIALVIIILGLIIYFVSKKTKQPTEISVEEISTVKETKEILPEPIKEEVTNKIIPPTPTTEVIIEEKPTNNLSISSKTENDLLRKLELFEKNKGFIKKDVNLASLSKQFETNTKYLSEIIKTHRQKQFNSYLNELRVDYIVNRLQNEPKYINTKVSYLASDSGFASHSTFTTTFTQIMNESPSAFVKRIKEEQKK
ncbi:helix-turn-helix domain-containing protein [Empedobacter falsenii]|uniref:helix-turn-helix domain-containing protein n=1 Tax=Empedobacter falsenii TaxID=343874 RepID=UPI0025766006|nr:helix-turn-helix domain-containing protein [Empedobacter falsenii]MDM1298503.1 helix-turn-helix domain-containing protein [Empedobacter falsenii]MDM1318296.1 helix-turn-helix domain-containing protein [Empedobacter falsenii]